jgi:rhomboid protease GluP
VTFGILPVLATVFLLELLWDATSDITVLVGMGALVPELVQAGEWWRLGSATLLHGDFMHLAFNCYVLFALGVFLEKVLGSWRTLALYCGAALGGSLVSMAALGGGISVGASGALFGFLGGHAVLAFHDTGLVPKSALPGVRKAAVINLAINVVNSMRPNIDWAAHLGGLVLGVVLVLFVLRRGLPRLNEPDPPARLPRGSVAFGILGLAWLGASLAGALAMGQPWDRGGGPVLTATQVEGLPFTFSVPESMALQEGAIPPTWGRFPLNPAVVSVGMASLDPVAPHDARAVLEDIGAQLKAEALLPEGVERVGEPVVVDVSAWLALRSELKVGELRGEQLYVPTAVGIVMIESVWIPARNDWAQLSTKVARTLVVPE